MPTPSLLIVPARFKSGKLYSQIPTSGAGDFTVTRATAATRVNASGLIESVASGIPRLDYFASGGTVGCPALLVEPSAQNICLQSEAIGVTSWSNTAITVSSNVSATLDPASGNTAEKIVATAVSGNHFTTRAASTQTGQHTFSVFAKAAEYSFIRLQDLNAGKYNVWFDLLSGTANGTGASIQNYGNGWYRCSVTYDGAGASVANGLVGVPTSGGGVSYTGNGTSGIYVWGAQLETGSVATSYIPTTTGSVTRNADVISVSGAVSGSIGQASGTIYAEVDVTNTGNKCIICLSDNSSGNQLRIRASINSLTILNTIGGVTTIKSLSPTLSGISKIAIAYASGDYMIYLNGTQLSGYTDLNAPTPLTRIDLGARQNNTEFFNDRIRSAALYNTRLTNAELAALTSP